MDEQCHKNYLVVVLSGLKIHLNLGKVLKKTTMKIVMKDIFFKETFNNIKIYMTFTMIYHFFQEERKNMLQNEKNMLHT